MIPQLIKKGSGEVDAEVDAEIDGKDGGEDDGDGNGEVPVPAHTNPYQPKLTNTSLYQPIPTQTIPTHTNP